MNNRIRPGLAEVVDFFGPTVAAIARYSTAAAMGRPIEHKTHGHRCRPVFPWEPEYWSARAHEWTDECSQGQSR